MNNKAHMHCDINHCFCETPLDELRQWAYRKYHQGMTTQALMAQASSEREREMVAIVALFEVPEEELLRIMGSVDKPEHHILHCREYFRDLLT